MRTRLVRCDGKSAAKINLKVTLKESHFTTFVPYTGLDSEIHKSYYRTDGQRLTIGITDFVGTVFSYSLLVEKIHSLTQWLHKYCCPGRYQQNAQLFWSSLLTEMGIVTCVWVSQEFNYRASLSHPYHNAATTTTSQILAVIFSLFVSKPQASFKQTVCMLSWFTQ